MEVYEIYVNEKHSGWKETLDSAKALASTFFDAGVDVRIEHPCSPSPTEKWRRDYEVDAWVSSSG